MRIPTLTLALALTAGPVFAQGVQVTPNEAQTLVGKDLAGERWAIAWNADDGSITGNVFRPGDNPQFVWCSEKDRDDASVTVDCFGADRCPFDPCGPEGWIVLAEIELPLSFFEPKTDEASSLAEPQGSGSASTPAGVQTTIDSKRRLVSKDIADERWAIVRNDDGTVTGNVLTSSGTSFVWCSDEGETDTTYSFECHGADACEVEPCGGDDWSSLGEVDVPKSFFEPPPSQRITSADDIVTLIVPDSVMPEGGVSIRSIPASELSATLQAVPGVERAWRLAPSGTEFSDPIGVEVELRDGDPSDPIEVGVHALLVESDDGTIEPLERLTVERSADGRIVARGRLHHFSDLTDATPLGTIELWVQRPPTSVPVGEWFFADNEVRRTSFVSGQTSTAFGNVFVDHGQSVTKSRGSRRYDLDPGQASFGEGSYYCGKAGRGSAGVLAQNYIPLHDWLGLETPKAVPPTEVIFLLAYGRVECGGPTPTPEPSPTPSPDATPEPTPTIPPSTASTPPTIDDVVFPSEVHKDGQGNGTIFYSDPDGDVNGGSLASIEGGLVSNDPTPFSFNPTDMTSGQIPFNVGCPGEIGPFSVQIILTDADGNESAPYQVDSECVDGATCGNGIREGGEQCDGDDLGGATCPPEYESGEVTCTAGCTIDMSGCEM